MNAENSIVTVDLTFADYDELYNLLSTCAEVCCGYPDPEPELVDLAADFRYFCELLESNRR